MLRAEPFSARSETVAEHERRLISEVLQKDRKATAEFVSLCADWVYPYVRHRLMPERDLVEDLVQEILLAAWKSLDAFRGEGGLRSWILGIARHKVEDFYRKKMRDAEISEEDYEVPEPSVLPFVEARLDGEEQQKRIERTLALLTEPYRAALLWRYRDGRSSREIAELAGKTEKAVERLLARAREQFRNRWNDADV